MIFDYMGWDGFESHGPGEQKLSDQGIMLIEGVNLDDPTASSNGSGKSGLPTMLTWCLTGRTLKEYKLADDVVNSHKEGGTEVQTKFMDDAGKLYRVTRYRKHPEKKNRLEFMCGTRDLSETDPDATQAKIFEVLGMDFDTLHHSMIFGQGFSNHFATLTDKGQKAIAEKMLGLEAISKTWKKVREAAGDLNSKIDRWVNSPVAKTIERLTLEIDEAEKEKGDWFTSRGERLDDAKASLKELRSAKRPSVAKAQEAVASTTETYAKALEVWRVAGKRRAKASEALAVAKADMSSMEDEGRRLAKAVDKLDTAKVGSTCEACGSEINKHTKTGYADHLASVQKTHKTRLATLTEAVKKAREELGKAAEAEEVSERTKAAAENRKEAALAVLGEARVGAEKTKQAEERVDAVAAEVWPGKARLSRLRDERGDAEDEAAKVHKDIEAAEDEMVYLAYLELMLSDKGGADMPPLKGCVLDSVLPFLNKKASYYSKLLTAGNIQIAFETQTTIKSRASRDRFEVTAINKYGAKCYAGNSGGERRKIDICVALGLQALAASRAKCSVNIAFYDEVFDALDDTGAEAVMELLSAEAKRYSSLFVITHQTDLQSYFPRSIRVVKQNGISTIKR